MRRAFRETRLVVASHNAGNVREIGDLLRPLGVETVSAADLDLSEPEETEASFEGNARLKALEFPRHRHLRQLEGDIATVADDLGADLDQPLPECRQRPVLDLLRQYRLLLLAMSRLWLG